MRNDNCFTHLSCFDYINHFFSCKTSQYKSLISISENLVRHSLSVEEIIKDSINLNKIVKIVITEMKYALNAIEPYYIKEMKNNKIIF